MKVTSIHQIPDNSMIANGFGEIHFFDTYRISKKTQKSIGEIQKQLMNTPRWVDFLIIIRNKIVGMFGLKTERSIEAREQASYFKIIFQNENESIMGENDKHLDFRSSIMIDREYIYLITLVHFNNAWGKVYFFPVKPFHKIIMRKLMKNNLKDL